MSLEWEEKKARANHKKHGISFDEARRLFDGPVLTRVDDREDYGEVHEISLGLLSPHAPLVVVHTVRGGKTRLLSARKANRWERKIGSWGEVCGNNIQLVVFWSFPDGFTQLAP